VAWVDVELYPCLTSVLDGVNGQHDSRADLPLGKRPGTHFTGGRIVLEASLYGTHNLSLPHLVKDHEQSSP
jgi:hypothetical protein